jgi:ABC-2 type transport system permease protein
MRSFLTQLSWELRKLWARKRTRLGFAALPVFQLLLMWMLKQDSARALVQRAMERAGFTFAENFSGLTVATIIVGPSMSLLGGLFIALVAGEIVSKDVEEGTLRMILSRPVSRTRALAIKYLTCLIYACTITIYVCAMALALGLLFEGPGYLLVLPLKVQVSAHHEFWPGLVRYIAAAGLLAVSVFNVTALAFLFSCLKMKPAAATALAVLLYIVDDTLRSLPFFATAQGWFFTSRTISWLYIYPSPIQWDLILRNFGELLAFDLTLFAVAWWVFLRRDFKA